MFCREGQLFRRTDQGPRCVLNVNEDNVSAKFMEEKRSKDAPSCEANELYAIRCGSANSTMLKDSAVVVNCWKFIGKTKTLRKESSSIRLEAQNGFEQICRLLQSLKDTGVRLDRVCLEVLKRSHSIARSENAVELDETKAEDEKSSLTSSSSSTGFMNWHSADRYERKTKWISVDECESIHAETYEGRIQVEFRMDQKFLKRYLEASYVNISDDQIRRCAADTHVNKIKDISKLKCCDLEIRGASHLPNMDFSLFRKDLSDPYVEMSIHSETKKKALFQACT